MADAGFVHAPGKTSFVRQEGRGCAIVTALVPDEAAAKTMVAEAAVAEVTGAEPEAAEAEAEPVAQEEPEKVTEEGAASDAPDAASVVEQLE